jgi:hypothetical protein
VVTKAVTLLGDGRATIVGCDDGPILFGSVRAGFYLPDDAGANAASGTRISGFIFDGEGVSNTNLAPLGLGVFARFANDVRVTHNLFLGTTQAVTNTAGDRWVIAHNRIRDLTLFDCTGTFCSGGAGVAIDVAPPPSDPADPASRPEDNLVLDNDIAGTIPDGFDVFSMVGVFIFAADGTVVAGNRIAIPDNPTADATGEGILVDDACCGEPPVAPGARNTRLLFNDGAASEIAIVVDGTGGANTQGLVLFGNRGVEVIEGVTTRGPGPRRLPRHSQHVRRFF